MKAITIHGKPDKEEYYSSEKSPSNSHWLSWLQNKLIQAEILSQTPEMPLPFHPEYNSWKDTISQFKIDNDTILIGHSCGAGFLVKYLSQNNLDFKHLFLVAPWIDPTNSIGNNFFEKTFDNKLDGSKITIFISTDDDEDILNSVEEIKNSYSNAKTLSFTEKGHFCFGDLGTEEFPELLEEIIKLK